MRREGILGVSDDAVRLLLRGGALAFVGQKIEAAKP
jgi:hypothetical protein